MWLGWEDRPEPRHETIQAHAIFDRPFGFLTRPSGLVLAAGWVTGPKPFPEDEDAYVLDTPRD
ncbi:hypothetical protein [Streptomyces sp. NPDC057002]|uniref:hypothetical protein n=1 Tax=Streptomyces sp. NPDC057002 TaxID=3345992 RepID=UPI003638C942